MKTKKVETCVTLEWQSYSLFNTHYHRMIFIKIWNSTSFAIENGRNI